jgi:hypothetical protein
VIGELPPIVAAEVSSNLRTALRGIRIEVRFQARVARNVDAWVVSVHVDTTTAASTDQTATTLAVTSVVVCTVRVVNAAWAKISSDVGLDARAVRIVSALTDAPRLSIKNIALREPAARFIHFNFVNSCDKNSCACDAFSAGVSVTTSRIVAANTFLLVRRVVLSAVRACWADRARTSELEDVGVERTPEHTIWTCHHGYGTIIRASTVVVELITIWELIIEWGFFAHTLTLIIVDAGMSVSRTARVRWREKGLLISHAAVLARGAAPLHETLRRSLLGGKARSWRRHRAVRDSGHPVTSMAVNG